MSVTIKVRRGTAAQWTAANPTLSSGEFGLETDTGKGKIGDGATAWNSLNYIFIDDIDTKATSTVQASEPSSPNAGDLWLDTDTNFSYIYDGSQWVLAGGGASGGSKAFSLFTGGM